MRCVVCVCCVVAVMVCCCGVIPLSELDFAHLLQVCELPLDERVVVWVDVGGDERPSPVNASTHLLQISLCVQL